MARGVWCSLVVVLVTLTSVSEALKCFHCTNCGDNVGSIDECDSGYDVCMKISLADTVQKTCAQKAACSLGAVERGAVNAWNSFKNYFSDVDQDLVDIPDDAEAKIVECCDTELCNSAFGRVANPALHVLLLLPLALYFLRY